MKIAATLKLVLLLTLVAPMTHAQQTLNSLKDRNRVLLIFAPDSGDRRFIQQIDQLTSHAADLSSRDVVLLPVVPDSSVGTMPSTLRAMRPPLVHDDEKITLRKRFHVDPSSFTVILLGKDGGAKLKSTTPISAAKLNRTIDAMPMRQQEMRNQH